MMKLRICRIRTAGCALLATGWMVATDVAQAVPVVFNLRDNGATTEIESGTITRSGITAMLSPAVAGGSGVLNQTTSGFGVDALGTGDVTSQLDAGLGTESILISFNIDVSLTQLVLSVFSNGERASLGIGLNPVLSLTDTGSGADTFNFLANNQLLAGQTIVLSHVSGNGFSFDSFTVEVLSSPVPESIPSAFSLLFFGGLIGLLHRCRSRLAF